MYGASSAFASAITKSHVAICKIEVYKPSPFGHGYPPSLVFTSATQSQRAFLIDGTVTVSRSATPRRSFHANIAISNYGLFKTIFDPRLGYDVCLHRGIRYADQTEDYVPLGVFKLDSAEITSQQDGLTVALSGQDLSATFAKAQFKSTFSIASGADYFTTVLALFDIAAPVSQYFDYDTLFSPTTYTMPVANFTEKDSPWNALLKIAESMGAEAYYNQTGNLCVSKILDTMTLSPVLDLTAGTSGVRVGPLKRKVNMATTFNGVVVRASAPWLLLPVEGEVWDEDAFSPTYRYGPFGQRPEYVEDAMVTTSAQATVVATARFNAIRGAAESVSFGSLPDPRLDVGDPVTVTDTNLGIRDTLYIDTLSIPLRNGAMTGTLKLCNRSTF